MVTAFNASSPTSAKLRRSDSPRPRSCGFRFHPAELLDRIRDPGWLGVVGNTDEMLSRPESLEESAAGLPDLRICRHDRGNGGCEPGALGEARLQWLSELPRIQIQDRLAFIHATPEPCWCSHRRRQPIRNSNPSTLLSHKRSRFTAMSVNTSSAPLGYDSSQNGKRQSLV
jgi:hypothetical protein